MWKLPSGKIIINPQAGRTFLIGDVAHNETHLLRWSDERLLALGIHRVRRVGFDSTRYTCSGYTEEVVGPVIIQRPILEETSAPFIQARKTQLKTINMAVNSYILDRYDLGTQATYQALYALPTTPPTIKGELLSLFEWIRGVLAAYYVAKNAIIAAIDFDGLNAVTFDTSAFDATDPGLHLQEVLGRLPA